MSIDFTKHALERIKARNIDKNDVLNTLKKPDKIIKKTGMSIAQKKVKHQLLRVFYKEEKGAKTIITAYKVSDYKRYL